MTMSGFMRVGFVEVVLVFYVDVQCFFLSFDVVQAGFLG